MLPIYLFLLVGFCWSRGAVLLSSPTFLTAEEFNPSKRSVPSASNDPRIVEAFQATMDAVLDKRQSELQCGFFEVTFVGVTPGSKFRTAMCYALREIVSSRFDTNAFGPTIHPVRIRATFLDLGANKLGAASPVALCPDSDSLYKPTALFRLRDSLDAACNGSVSLEYDIDMSFTTNSGIRWYLGMDANPPADSYDFVTTVAHETLHGLGFSSGLVFTQDDSGYVDSVAYFDPVGLAFFDSTLTPALNRADLFLWTEMPKVAFFTPPLFNNYTSAYLNQSVYSPPDAIAGSSVSHWAYSVADSPPPLCEALDMPDCNSLMLPGLSAGQALHRMGGNTLNMLGMMGYPVLDCTQLSEEECRGEPDKAGARCDWCVSGEFCTLIEMVDYVWMNTTCPGNQFLLPKNGPGVAGLQSAASALSDHAILQHFL